MEFFTTQNGERTILEIIKSAIWRRPALSCKLSISSLNNFGELERLTQIILFCGTKPNPKNSITFLGENYTNI
jgi:hypothetical protein